MGDNSPLNAFRDSSGQGPDMLPAPWHLRQRKTGVGPKRKGMD